MVEDNQSELWMLKVMSNDLVLLNVLGAEL